MNFKIQHRVRTGEAPGGNIFFISREKMESEIESGKFVEQEEFRGHLHGTSAESVKLIMYIGSVCITNPHWSAIKALRTPQLKPYVIFIKPRAYEELKPSRVTVKAIYSHDESSSRGFSYVDFHEMVDSSEKIEFLYGHFFNEIIVINDLESNFDEFFEAVSRSEN